MGSKTNMERVKRAEVVFWISSAAAMLLVILGFRWYSSPETPEAGYSASDIFSGLCIMSVGVMVSSGKAVIGYLKQEITALKSGEADDSGE